MNFKIEITSVVTLTLSVRQSSAQKAPIFGQHQIHLSNVSAPEDGGTPLHC